MNAVENLGRHRPKGGGRGGGTICNVKFFIFWVVNAPAKFFFPERAAFDVVALGGTCARYAIDQVHPPTISVTASLSSNIMV